MRTVKLFWEILKLLVRKYLFRQKNGVVLRKFVSKMGIAYIKFAQILAMQNFGELFTESDREILCSICDELNPVPFKTILRTLETEYGDKLWQIFQSIEEKPTGSASISQVHRAILISGEEVALKVKRKDVALTLKKDVKIMRKLVHHFGKIVGLKNVAASDRALDLYLDWVLTEVDFENEVKNISRYRDFANSVNGKVKGAKNILVPKVYEDLYTPEVIVMDFIHEKTINKLPLNSENQKRIREALNSYLSLSFYAMFHGLKIVFHGDPHGGNIYIDEKGNIGFLDLGLLFEISEDDAPMLMDFFLNAYSGRADRLYNMLAARGNLTDFEKTHFRGQLDEYCETVQDKEVSYYFVDMMAIVIGYNLVPPDFLFGMAKAFMCLNGIGAFSKNDLSATSLLRGQVAEYLLRRGATENFARLRGLAQNFLQGDLSGVLESGRESLTSVFETGKLILRDWA